MQQTIIAVTGAGGFIARNLIAELKKQHPESIIRGIDIIPAPYHECDDSIQCDLCTEPDQNPTLFKALEGVAIVYHLAGKVHSLSEVQADDDEYWRINVTGSRNLLATAQKQGVGKFIFFSSVKVFGEYQLNNGERPLSESDEPHPDTPYGKTKLEFERILSQECGDITPVILRLSMVYGPNAKGNLAKMIKAVQSRIPLLLPEFHNKRSMVDVRDVIRIAVLAGQPDSKMKGIYQVTDGNVYSTRQILDYIREALGKEASHFSFPKFCFVLPAKIGDLIGKIMRHRFFFDSDSLNKLAGNAWFSSDKLKQELQFTPEWNLQTSLLCEYKMRKGQ